MTIMALDVGDKRIGVAKTDPLNIIVQALTTIERSPKDLESICDLIREYQIKKLVIGLPLRGEGEVGIQAKKVKSFSKKLGEHMKKLGINIEIVLWDESMTTKEAEEFLMEAGVRRAKRGKIVDKMAAVFILESYLRGIE